MENNTALTNAEQFIKVTVKEVLDVKDKALIISAANKYTSAKREMGDVQTAFNELVNTIKQIEAKYSITVFTPEQPIGDTIERIASAVDVATNKFYGVKSHVCTFKTVEEANDWLSMQKDIVVKDMVVEARCRFGVYVQSVKIEYRTSDVALNKKYKIDTIDKFRVFASSKIEKVSCEWKEKNPQFGYVKMTKKAWAISLIGGSVGFLRFIKEKYFVVYSYNI